MWRPSPSVDPVFAAAVPQFPEWIDNRNMDYDEDDPLEINGRKRKRLLELTEGFYAGMWKEDEYMSLGMVISLPRTNYVYRLSFDREHD
ncbi:hypothetical protein L484_025972 [Morus notabilis]|uniref:Uncharacterized protein n=1 Tax=Morus notabilis TaxID=981085 RepID=W9R7Q2_9ROSA|nr:hypothetical protein L484_025972 [Morus notabilis]